jgi:primosomal protein N' (replication factor Y)
MQAPLKLKSERVGKLTLAEENPILSVFVDTGVFHLDYEFDYLLPSKFDLKPGQWVSVPFNGRNCLGLVASRSNKSATRKALPINRGIKGPYISPDHLNFYKKVANRWCVPLFDVLRFVTKYREQSTDADSKLGNSKRIYLQLPPDKNEIDAIRELARKTSKSGPTLLIVPESRVATQFENEEFDVSMRAGALSPKRYMNVLVLREESEHHYELKSPGFNTRDVVLLRNEILGENVIFAGYSPSLEMNRLIQMKYINFKGSSGRLNINVSPAIQGELIPSRLIKTFKEALKSGVVLVIVPNKGYGLAISCAACRNIAKCECGGKLTKHSKGAPPSCVICSKQYLDWHCAYCKMNRIYLLGKGIERIAEEFGKTFPNTNIHIATQDKEIEGAVSAGSIVIATMGAAPQINYSTVFLLEGLNLGVDLRSEERYLANLFKYAAYAKGRLALVERQEHPAANSLIRWNSLPYLNRLSLELEEAGLPPYMRHLLLAGEDSERIYTGILSAIRDGRLQNSTKVYYLNGKTISVYFDIKSSQQVLTFFLEFQKRRSMANKPHIKLRVDPYLLG